MGYTEVKVQQQTPDDDGQYGASLESLARDETRPTKYPTHSRGSGRVSEVTKRSMVGNVRQKDLRRRTAVSYRPHHDRPSFALARKKRRRRIVSCREAPGRRCEYKEEDAYCIRDGGHNCNAQVEYGHNDTILNRPFHISNSTILICLKHVCHGTFTHHKPVSFLPRVSQSGVISLLESFTSLAHACYHQSFDETKCTCQT